MGIEVMREQIDWLWQASQKGDKCANAQFTSCFGVVDGVSDNTTQAAAGGRVPATSDQVRKSPTVASGRRVELD